MDENAITFCVDRPPAPDSPLALGLADQTDTGWRVQVVSSASPADGGAVCLVDENVVLHPEAVAVLRRALADHPDAAAVYADTGAPGAPGSWRLRPAWSPTLLRHRWYLGDLLVLRRTPTLVPGPVADTGPATRWRLALGLIEAGASVLHVAAPLAHRSDGGEPDIPVDTDELSAHLDRSGLPWRVVPGPAPGAVRLEPLPGRRRQVTAIVPTAGVGRPRPLVEACLAALDRTEGVDLDVLVVVDPEFIGDPERLTVDRRHPTRLLERPPGPFDFAAACDHALAEAGGEYVLLLNDDVEPLDPGWLARMAAHLDDPGIGVVGARLLYPDRTIQHIGVVIDDARPLHPFVGAPADHPGPRGLLRHPREVAAVTGACLLARRRDVYALGGLSRAFPLSFNDTDLCLKMQAAGRRVVVEPDAVCVHHESASRSPRITRDEWDAWIARWGDVTDPWYHPAYHRPRLDRDRRRDADHLPPPALPDPRSAVVRDIVIRPRVHRSPAHTAARADRPRADTRVHMPELTPADGDDAPRPGPGDAEDPALGDDPVALRLEILRLRDVAAGAAARTAVLEDRVHELEDDLSRFEGLMEAHQALIARHEKLLAHPVLRAQRLLGRLVRRVRPPRSATSRAEP